jgi:hypothetical protein
MCKVERSRQGSAGIVRGRNCRAGRKNLDIADRIFEVIRELE